MSTQSTHQSTVSFTTRHDLTFTPTEPPDDHRSFSRDTIVEGVACTQLSGYQTVKGRKRELSCSPIDGYWVTDDADAVREYVDAFGDTVWPIPETYTAFDEFERYLGEMDGASRRYGYGIDATQLEKALRLLTGGGHYDHDAYTLVACGRKPFVLAGPEGVLLSRPGHIARPEDESQCPQRTITGSLARSGGEYALDVEEANPSILDGIQRLIKLADDAYEQCITSHEGAPHSASSFHFFETQKGASVKVSAETLETLGRLKTHHRDVSVYGGTTVDVPRASKTVDVAWDEPDQLVGDTQHGAPVVGYDVEWETRGRRRFSVLVVRTHRLVEREQLDTTLYVLRSTSHELERVDHW
ncbi:hypothetical protein [Halorubellus sp. PRR65]|uniref:hypothetical protein n=1 Tax=Halorubellus sp. PRR65 TaxID=3098148 RepID=UPI002B25F109|nr:hypothetical protein [Halorubellus sp. PRR65]